MDKGSSASSSESGSESDSESDDSEEERNNKVKLLEKELFALQEKMRKLVEESNTKKKAKKKVKDKTKKPVTNNAVPKANAAAAYAAKANNISETIGKILFSFETTPCFNILRIFIVSLYSLHDNQAE